MGLRGPKPLDKERLSFRAVQLANFLYTLRDGQVGRIKGSGVFGSVVAVVPLSGSKEKTMELLKKIEELSGTPFEVIPPVPANRTAWDHLKNARTEGHIRQAAASIRRWARNVDRRDWRTKFPRIISDHAQDLVRAKGGWNYPRKNRPKSDDKRIVFFAKVLAGLSLGLSPTYTTKELAYWPWTKDWIQGFFAGSEESFGGRIVSFLDQRKRRKQK